MLYIFLLLGVLARFIPHIPNFTPIMAISLFAGAYLSRKYALFVPILIMIVSDLILGMHEAVLFTWGAVTLIAVIGIGLRNKLSIMRTIVSGLISSLLFFVITNFGVWAVTSLYSHNLKGFLDCYIMALPFYRNQLVGDVIYMCALFGGYQFFAAYAKKRICQTV